MTLHRLTLWATLAAMFLGCSGSSTTTTPASSAADRPAASTHDRLHPGPPKPWTEMSHSERKTYMASTVVPTMAPLFKAHDEARFANFGCRTCHGDDAIKRRYAMPNPELRTLFPTGSKEQKDMVREDRDTLVFMFGTVLPNMRDLLGAEPYDDADKSGFSCYACHPKGIPAGAP